MSGPQPAQHSEVSVAKGMTLENEKKHGFKQINHDHDFKVHAELLMFIQRLYAPASWCFSASQAMEIGYKKSLGFSSN